MLRKILLLLLVIFVIIQFFRPAKNLSDVFQANNIETKYPASAEVKATLQKACYDCHSNNTKYPWYSNIQPVAWWLNKHIKDGKKELNFDEFTNYDQRRQYHKLEEIEEQMKEGGMPLKSYTLIHKEAILTDAERDAIYAWIAAARADMEVAYPKDSLVRRR